MENKKYQIVFLGKGGELFTIWIVNFLLQVVTLGLYYPWAKAKTLKYLWSSTEFEGSRFEFLGTGKEMFVGFIKALFLIVIIYLAYFFLVWQEMVVLATLVLLAGIVAILPLAIHGSYRYRMSRTSWRGIRFGYRGDRNELMKLIYKGVFFTIISLGIYSSWFIISIRNYVLSNIKFGNAKFRYEANATEYFFMNLAGRFFTVITFGIYFFWWQKNLYDYYINNLYIETENGERITFTSKVTSYKVFTMYAINILLVLFTLGIGTPWAIINTMNFVFSNMEIQGDIDIESIIQTEENHTDATAEDMADFFDFDLAL